MEMIFGQDEEFFRGWILKHTLTFEATHEIPNFLA